MGRTSLEYRVILPPPPHTPHSRGNETSHRRLCGDGGRWKGKNLGLRFLLFSRAVEYTCLRAWPGSAWLLQSPGGITHSQQILGYKNDTLGRYYGQGDRVSRESCVEGATSSECPGGTSAEGYKDLSQAVNNVPFPLFLGI